MQEIFILQVNVMSQAIVETSVRQKKITIITLKRTQRDHLTPSVGVESHPGKTSHIIAHEQVPAHGTGTRWILPNTVTNEAVTISGNTTIARILVGLTTD